MDLGRSLTHIQLSWAFSSGPSFCRQLQVFLGTMLGGVPVWSLHVPTQLWLILSLTASFIEVFLHLLA